MNDGLVLFIAIVCCIGFGILVANEWRKAYRVHRAAQPERSASKEGTKQPSFWWAFLAVLSVAGFAYAVEYLTGWDARLVAVITACAIAAMLVAALIGWPLWRHRKVFRMVRLAEAGEIGEAVFRIRHEIETKGPSAERWNTLAALLSVQNNWAESLHAFEEADRLGPPTPTDIANKGTVLWKMGHLEEAEQCLENAYGKEPNNFTTVSNYCLLMGDMKRIDKTKELLRRVEEIYGAQVVWPAAARRRRKEMLEECRQKVRGLTAPVQG